MVKLSPYCSLSRHHQHPRPSLPHHHASFQDIPSVDLVIGLKNMVELEESMIFQRLNKFADRAIPIFVTQPCTMQPGEQVTLQAIVPFREPINAPVICNWMLSKDIQMATTRTLIRNNRLTVNMTNSLTKPIRLHKLQCIGTADIRSIGYYMLALDTIQNNLTDYTFRRVDEICKEYNNLINTATNSPINIKDPYPWLKEGDWRKHATDEEILRKQINLNDSILPKNKQEKLRALCLKYKKAFSLRDEIGTCPNIKVHIELQDKDPFFVRPFRMEEHEKAQMDWEMERLVHLGILTKKSTSHTSPVRLISRKLTADARPVVDFRQLNTRILRRNSTTPLLRDVLNTLGRANVEVLSCIDFKDAYHSLELDEESKEYCGIVPYFGAPSYRFERVPMGLCTSPAMWIEYVNFLLQHLKNKEKYIAIMDDLLIFGSRKIHFALIEDLLKTCVELGLKISPRAILCHKMVYLGNCSQSQTRVLWLNQSRQV